MRKIIAVLLSIMLLTGCSSLPAFLPSAEDVPDTEIKAATGDKKAEAEQVDVPTKDEVSEQLYQSLAETFAVQVKDITVPEADSISAYVEDYRQQLIDLASAVDFALEDAFSYACAYAGASVKLASGTSIDMKDWKLIASLLKVGADLVPIATASDIKLTPDGEGGYTAVVTIASAYDVLHAQQGELEYAATVIYTYLNTLYDDAGEEKDFVQYELPEGYLETMTDPLPGRYIKNGWYARRDDGDRKHTGTDIKAPADTPILSCTAGTVSAIGSSEKGGNYVVIEDALGFQYHYYHMIRMTDFLNRGDKVNAGDVIGNVGNTGNSDANHLHLAIISPEYTYINPYLVLKELRALKS